MIHATGQPLRDLREAVQDRKKWRTLLEEKTWNRAVNSGEGTGKPLHYS
jgi:hypothetical protein